MGVLIWICKYLSQLFKDKYRTQSIALVLMIILPIGMYLIAGNNPWFWMFLGLEVVVNLVILLA